MFKYIKYYFKKQSNEEFTDCIDILDIRCPYDIFLYHIQNPNKSELIIYDSYKDYLKYNHIKWENFGVKIF
jgi:hypothetical protein